MFPLIRKRDLLVHHPYESFTHSVERFVSDAADDPSVLAIKMTLYRTGNNSPFVPMLIRAAEAGKQVVALVEIKARFDEERNIRLARELERAGVHVVYGVVGLKTHCKTTLVVRKEVDGIRSYAHIGTGNYHPATSQIYTDLSLFTSSPEITSDIAELFHFLTGRSLKRNYQKLLVAPVGLKDQLIQMIRLEAEHARSGVPAQIVAKMNSLEDPEVAEAIVVAVESGVKVDLIVRGAVCLEIEKIRHYKNFRLVSIIGRFLEHSRVVYFRSGQESPYQGKFYIGSADWMSRNLCSRVEALVPIDDCSVKAELWDVLQLMLDDQRQSWVLRDDGNYSKDPEISIGNDPGVHERLMRHYSSRSLSSLLARAESAPHGWMPAFGADSGSATVVQ